jgi:metal-sulfur cluster biosynthetic enzyme
VVSSDDVRAVLSTVIHPTFGLSLVTLQMIKAVQVNRNEITVELVMDCPGCPAAEAALAQVSQKLQALHPAPGRVTVSLALEKWSPPWEAYWFTPARGSFN